MDFDQLATELKTARRARGLSQEDLAKTLGMSRATISALESGRFTELGVRKLVALLQQVGLDLQIAQRAPRPTIDDLRAARRREKDRS